MSEIFKKIKYSGSGYLITDSKQLHSEFFLSDSGFRNKDKKFCVEEVLPEELRNPLAPGEIAYIEFSSYTEYDDFWRKISRNDFMAHHLESLMSEAKEINIGRKKVYAFELQFYQGYENGEFPGERYSKKYAKDLHLNLEKTDDGFNLHILPIFS